MQIVNNLSSSFFTSYTQKKESNKEFQITSRFSNSEIEKAEEIELIVRSKTDELQSRIAQMKKEYLEAGTGENDTNDWVRIYGGGRKLRDTNIPFHASKDDYDHYILEMEQQYPTYEHALKAVFRDMYNTNMNDFSKYFPKHANGAYESRTHQYTKDDFSNAMNNIEKAVTQLLEQEFEKDSTSDTTNILILFKAQIESIPTIFEQAKQQVLRLSKQNDISLNGLLTEYDIIITSELERLDMIAAQMGDAMPELKAQLDNSVKILYDYVYSSFDESFSLVDPDEFEEAFEEFFLDFSSRIALADNTETLLNLTSDSLNPQNHAKESKTYESLIDRIRAKLKTTDDSILQKVMSKITNAPKSAEASA